MKTTDESRAALRALVRQRRGARAIVRAPRDRPLEASLHQEALWVQWELDPTSTSNNLSHVMRITGRLDADALAKTIDHIALRHEVLRTSLTTHEGRLLQVVHPPDIARLERLDLRGAGARDVDDQFLARTRMSFDLRKAPLWRATLVHLDADVHALWFVAHHIIWDGGSQAAWIRELERAYALFARGVEPDLPPLQLQYADFATSQRRRLEQVEAEQIAYWAKRLDGASPVDVLRDDGAPRDRKHTGAAYRFVIDAGCVGDLREIARRTESTLFNVVLAAYAEVLGRWSRQDDVVVTVFVNTRTLPGAADVIGCFYNAVPLRIDLGGGATFEDLVQRTRATALDGLANIDLPFGSIMRAAKQTGKGERAAPFAKIAMTFTRDGDASLRFGDDARGTIVPLPARWSEELDTTADIELVAIEGKETIQCVFVYDATRYERATMERMADAMRALLEGAAKNANACARKLPILRDAEHKRLLRGGRPANDATHALGDLRIDELFAAQAARTPDAIALETEGARMTYRELDLRSDTLAAELSDAGIGPKTLVAVLMERSIEMVIAVNAIMKTGAAYAPLDPAHPAARVRFMVEDLGAKVVLVEPDWSGVLPSGVRAVIVDARRAFTKRAKPTPRVTDDDAAYVIYTSGSTGTPKAAINSHRGFRNQIFYKRELTGLTSSDVVFLKSPYTFDVSVTELFLPLIVGAKLVVASADGHRDPSYLARRIRETGVTTMQFVPSMLRAFLEEPTIETCTTLKRVLSAGEVLPRAVVTRFHERLACELVNLYGPTECAIDATGRLCPRAEMSAGVPIGVPVHNTRIYVLDADGAPCPVGVPGELCIGGVQVGLGYHRRPDLTAEKFVPDPFGETDGARMYRTGDLARWLASGEIEYLGRLDHQVKIRGLRIELGEIEAALSSCHGVRQGTAIVRDDAALGGVLVGYVVWKDGARRDTREIGLALGLKLPEYMVPTSIVTLETMPLTTSGKVDRKALPAPDRESRALYIAPRTEVEEILARAFERTLRLPRVGVNDDFFALGGHSLLVMDVVASIRATLKKEIRVRDFFDAPTVEKLAQSLRELTDDGVVPPALVRTDVERSSVTSFEEDLVLHWEARRAASATWNYGFGIDAKGPLDAARLLEAVRATAERQESLRHVFTKHGETWGARLCRSDDIPFERRDVRGKTDAEIATMVRAEIDEPFVIDGKPLARFLLLERAPDQHTLVVAWHEVVNDPTGSQIVVSDIAEHYAALGENREPSLPCLPIRYVDYAKWARDWFLDGGGRADVAAARERLVGAQPLELVDHPGDAPITPRKVKGGFVLDEAQTERFERLCRAESMTRFMALSAIVGVLLRRWSEQDDFVFVTPANFRTLRPELANLVGRFINPIALRTSVAGDTWRKLFANTREAARSYSTEWAPISLVFGAESPVDHPFCRVSLNIMGDFQPGQPIRVGDLTLDQGEPSALTGARNNLFFGFGTLNGRFLGHVGASADRYEESTIVALAAELRDLISGVDLDAKGVLSGPMSVR